MTKVNPLPHQSLPKPLFTKLLHIDNNPQTSTLLKPTSQNPTTTKPYKPLQKHPPHTLTLPDLPTNHFHPSRIAKPRKPHNHHHHRHRQSPTPIVNSIQNTYSKSSFLFAGVRFPYTTHVSLLLHKLDSANHHNHNSTFQQHDAIWSKKKNKHIRILPYMCTFLN